MNTYAYTSNFALGDGVNLNGLQCIVTGVWFEGSHDNPNIQLKWFHEGSDHTTWIRESILIKGTCG